MNQLTILTRDMVLAERRHLVLNQKQMDQLTLLIHENIKAHGSPTERNDSMVQAGNLARIWLDGFEAAQ